ncbi:MULTISPECIES: bifunctional 23S rRNA (guanine(2069)-N(7))-methyltransferase RlmK/23S rRNA (guanine(2445)-N(2))-methyltransferase RlmL [unclassified Vibrio]|uniref:Ribosomal RNA large subunit methyltransferase K/L n=1 Tax=Vibrio sp. HB236076 TaxID=3232307 RepID=A0AB39HD65_9VIBR|nr:bifunctional 23S rRNA (guanine(2069)-N(7))-methyltransferase RlmK/23S rRNA (guanine(2445)-N(2))-methyltransferase RlmL [Vibrio sp. HB161653]MDP5253395.1 bifunctional 23S rRNA (guanine(2069)-N(7))-methyltransferase RlmK/23S rRNA (guanine(2445)-N(2))-methyltransferase RlmL [Vibrio sp. HB161653]
MNQYLAVTSNGMENLVVEELKRFGINDPKPVQAGVKFKASLEQIYRCCLWSRLASRFVRILSEFQCQNDMDLYLATHAVAWPDQFHSGTKLVVDFNGTNREIRNSQYGALKVKDAIVDAFEKKGFSRPSISKDNPDVRVHVRLFKDQAILGIDMVGGGLHFRGYRPQSGSAPLRETLAAAIVMRSQWDETKTLLDPMCGSGTLLIEAAMIAANIAPGLKRKQWCFEGLKDFDHALWMEIKSEANVIARRSVNKIDSAKMFGFDLDEKVISIAKENARRAGVANLVQFSQGDATTIENPITNGEPGVIVCNPPYGERLSTEPGLIALYTAFGAQLKAQFTNWSASIFSSSDELLSCLRMRADKQFKLNNGALPCVQKNYVISSKPQRQGDSDSNSQETLVAPDFANRLKKNHQKLSKWAKKEQLDCFRLYDADLPEYNVAIDKYCDHVVVQEYAAPKNIPEEKAKRRLTDVIRATIQVLGIDANKVIIKVRQKQKGQRQYQKLAEKAQHMIVNEYGVQLKVNLTDYLDTGLFLDHKLTRKMVGEMSQGKDFLNLFAYTGSATVHAAVGQARSTTTVDMSNTYLDWAKENMQLNGRIGRQHQFIQADCLQWLEQENKQYDLIFIDPPTFSNSKRMDKTFDVQRDHIDVMTHLKRILKPDGVIVFSNNKRHFKMDMNALIKLDLTASNISDKTLPLDFLRNKHIHNCWLVTHSK